MKHLRKPACGGSTTATRLGLRPYPFISASMKNSALPQINSALVMPASMHINIMYTHVHTHAHTDTRTHRHTHTHVHTRTHRHTQTHTWYLVPGKHCHYGHVSPYGADNIERRAGPCSREPSPAAMDLAYHRKRFLSRLPLELVHHSPQQSEHSMSQRSVSFQVVVFMR